MSIRPGITPEYMPDRSESFYAPKIGTKWITTVSFLITQVIKNLKSINRRMKISIIVYSDHGTLYSNEKEIKYSPTKTLPGSPRHNTEWKKSGKKGYILYNSVYLKFKNRQHLFTVMKHAVATNTHFLCQCVRSGLHLFIQQIR